jgi:anti-repressor protein
MENNLPQIFQYEGSVVRTIIKDNGDILFISKDICDVLKIKNSRQAISRLEEDEKGVIINDTPSGKQEMSYVTENGLYSLVMSTRTNDNTRKFKRWVTHEVLPTLRKTGSYSVSQPDDDTMIMAKALQIASRTIEAKNAELEVKEIQIDLMKDELKKQAPIKKYYEEVLQSESTYATTSIASELGMSAWKLNQVLKDKRIQRRVDGHWVLLGQYTGLGLTKTRTHYYTDSQGRQQTSMLTVWTEKGRLFIHKTVEELERKQAA